MANKISAKQYLQQVSRLDKMINNKLSEIYQLRNMATSITVANEGDRVQTSGSKDRMGDAVAKIVDLEDEAHDLIVQYTEMYKRIVSQIEAVQKEKYYMVLHMRYIECKTFEQISVEIGYSYRQTTRLHGEALTEFERLHGKKLSLNVL